MRTLVVHNQEEYLSIPGLNGRVVLLLSNDSGLRDRLEAILRGTGMQTIAVSDFNDARAQLMASYEQDRPVDVVMVDAALSGGTSASIVEWIGRHPDYAEALVMLNSAAGYLPDAELARDHMVINMDMQTDPAKLLRALCSVLGLPQPVAIHAKKGIDRHERSLTVLVAEDNPLNQKLAIRLLEKMGHQVVFAETGREAVELLQAVNIDAILMDVDMPDMDGYQATAEIRSRERESGRHVPIMAMTAHVLPEVRKTCMEVGMDGFLAKPVSLKELEAFLAGIARDGGSKGYVDAEKNPALYAEMAQMFLNDFPGYLSSLESSLSAGDTNQIRRSAHALKGMCMVFSAEAASNAASEVERTAGMDSCAEAVVKLGGELSRLEAELEQRLQATRS